VLFIDLDRFKHINDSLGHHVGDELLRSVARRLVQAVRTGDTVSRLGGDEFVVVLNGVSGPEEVSLIVQQRLIARVREPHAVAGAELHVSCSIGIAMYPGDADDLDTLMRHADTAMYEAKAAGKDAARFFVPEMTERAQVRLRLETRLRQAHEQGALALHWQPRVAAQGGALIGVEGLLRWTDRELGAISPAEFVPIAEETGLIVPIGAWVIDQACAQIAAWSAAGLPAFGVSINLSARQLSDSGLVGTVRDALQRHGVAPERLELELTESVVMEGDGAHHGRIQALRALGVAIAIDDFGTGYSSLAYLSRLPCDRLKIDRSFVHDLLGDTNARAIVRAIIGLGHTLGLTVVAEGVEREAEAALLREAGCDELQGFLYARPMPAEALAAWLQAWPAAPVAQAPAGLALPA
jgi:diguanylate cyclase (GGDEF)-like protein